MRIIAGQYRGRNLETLEGEDVRPTLDRAKETLFNVLQFEIDNTTRVLDMFAGSGSLGIEALSRGAEFACFFDLNSAACAVIKRNLERVSVAGTKYSIYKGDYRSLSYLRKGMKYDIIFVDPPYVPIKAVKDGENLCVDALRIIADADLLSGGGYIVCEHRGRNRLPESVFGFKAVKFKKIGIVGLTFFQKERADEG